MVGLVLCNVCKMRNVWFLKEMLSKFYQNPCSCFGYRLSYNNPNEVIPIFKEPKDIGIQIYRRDQKQIVALRLPNMGLNVSSGSSRVMLSFGYCYSILPIS